MEIFQEWLADDPDDPIARHMLAACSGRDVPARASDAFIEKTFDSFAASFDSKLAKLSYRAPQLVTEVLKRSDAAPSQSLDVLDAGCGTGLWVLCSHPMRVAWSASISRSACSPRLASGMSTTSSSNVN